MSSGATAELLDVVSPAHHAKLLPKKKSTFDKKEIS
jgi:hypothetical protein